MTLVTPAQAQLTEYLALLENTARKVSRVVRLVLLDISVQAERTNNPVLRLNTVRGLATSVRNAPQVTLALGPRTIKFVQLESLARRVKLHVKHVRQASLVSKEPPHALIARLGLSAQRTRVLALPAKTESIVSIAQPNAQLVQLVSTAKAVMQTAQLV